MSVSPHLITPWMWLVHQDQTHLIGHALTPMERAGFIAFWTGPGLLRKGPDWEYGWWIGHRLAYGQGVKASIVGGAREVSCPYVQFSGPWEAWCDGYNDEGAEIVPNLKDEDDEG